MPDNKELDRDEIERIATEMFTRLSWWEYNHATESEFILTFGEEEGKHLWTMYHNGEDLLSLWGRMDSINRQRLVGRILYHYKV